MSISFRKLRAKWSSTETMKNQKIAFSQNKLAKVHAGILLTVSLFSVVYLIQVNTLATKGYAIRTLEGKISNQKKANERIGLEIIEAQSLGTLQKKIDELKLVKADHIDYIKGTSSVASALSPRP